MKEFGSRILVLSPHPDDEVVGAAALIARARAAGVEVWLWHMTTGVPAQETMWPWQRAGHADRVARRRAEAKAVAQEMGCRIAGFSDRPTRSLRLNLSAARTELSRFLHNDAIDAVWVPAYEGGHSDHDAANALASVFKNTVSIFEFAEYNFVGSTIQSQMFVHPNGTETILNLAPDDVAEKRRLLGFYPSEAGNLGYVDQAREAIRPLAVYDYGKPPHEGKMFYQRFQWVPFRHPRIDWTTPEEVSADAVAFIDRQNGTD